MLPVRPALTAILIAVAALPAAGPVRADNPLSGADTRGDAGQPSKIWMNETDLRAALAGKAVAGEYPSGREFHETYEADGRVAYADDLRASGGHWSIESGAFCTIYDDDPMGGCFRVHKVGSNCYEFYFVARTEEEARAAQKEPSWTARAWLEQEPATCKDHISA